MRNDFPSLEASHGAAMAGCYAVPINWRWSPEEVAYLLRDCGARVIVAHADLLHLLAEAPPGLLRLVIPPPAGLRAAYAAGEDGEGDAEWESWLAAQPEWEGPPAPPRESMIYTSGTTGRPRAAPAAHARAGRGHGAQPRPALWAASRHPRPAARPAPSQRTEQLRPARRAVGGAAGAALRAGGLPRACRGPPHRLHLPRVHDNGAAAAPA